MSDEKVLTKEIAEQWIADEDSVDLSEFTTIEEDVAEFIGLASVDPFFVQNYTASNRSDFLYWLSGVSELSPNTILLLRPSLKELSRMFSCTLTAAVEEIRDSGNGWLTKNTEMAESGFNALFWPVLSHPASSDDCVFISTGVSGYDVFGEDLKDNTLYYSLVDELLRQGDGDECKELLHSLIGEYPMACNSVSFEGYASASGGYYIPFERLCECLKESNWPHVDEILRLGLKALTTDQARAVAETYGSVYLGDDLESISEDCAAILADGRADVTFYCTSIPATESHWKLVKRWGDIDNFLELTVETISDEFADYIFQIGKSYSAVVLGSVKVMSDVSLGSLVRIQGELGLGLTTLSYSQATILSQHNAKLSLYELVNLSDETATLLSGFPYELFIDNLDNIPDSAAAILRNHHSFADEEDEDYEDE